MRSVGGAEGDELLRRGRMHRHGGVEVGLRGAHLDRNGEKLRHLAGARPEHMRAEHDVGVGIDDELHQHAVGAAGQRALQRAEGGLVDVEVAHAARGPSSSVSPTVPISGCENTAVATFVVVRLGRAVAEDGVDEAHRLVDGDRRQLQCGRSRRRSPRCGRRSSANSRRPGSRPSCRARRRRSPSPSPSTFGSAADGEHDLVGLLDLRRSTDARAGVRRAASRSSRKISPQRMRMPRFVALRVEQPAQIHVEARQHLAAAIDDRRVDAEAGENAGELDRDIAAAADQDLLRQLLQVERLVGGDAVLVAFERGVRVGPSAGGDQDVLGGDDAAARARAGCGGRRRASRGVSISSAPALARLAR